MQEAPLCQAASDKAGFLIPRSCPDVSSVNSVEKGPLSYCLQSGNSTMVFSLKYKLLPVRITINPSNLQPSLPFYAHIIKK